MALLAVIDVEDLATEKIAKVKSALDDLVSRKTSTTVSTGPLAQQYQQQASAITQLIDQQRKAEAQARAYAAALNILNTSLKTGGTITDLQVKAWQQLGAELQKNTAFAQTFASQLKTINTGMQPGVQASKELVTALQQVVQGYTALTAAGQQAAGASAAVNASLQTTAQGLTSVGAAGVQAGAGIQSYFSQVQAAASVQQAATQAIQLYGATLATLTTTLQAGVPATMAEASAMRELAAAAQAGNGFTAQQAQTLNDLNAKMQQGIPLTQAEVQQLKLLNEQYVAANSAALGLGSAIQILMGKEQAHQQQIQQTIQALRFLNDQLRVGSTITPLQARAWQDLSAALQKNQQFMAQHGALLAKVNAQMKEGAVATSTLSKGVGQVTQAYQQFNGVAQTSQKLSEQLQASSLALTATFGALAAGVGGYLHAAGQLAARVEVLGTVLGVVGKNAFQTTAALDVQIERITKLGITTQEATDSIVQFMQANLKVADASKVARAAQDLAVVAGENSSATFQRLTRAIQIGETMLLRQVGIITTNEQIWREYAKTIGKTMSQLDAFEKKQAFLNKILQESERVAGAYEAAMGDVGKAQTSLARFSEELRLKLGQALLPAMMLIVRVQSDLYKTAIALPPSWQAAATAAMVFATAIATVATAFAAAKFLGIITMLEGMAAVWVKVTVAAKAAAATEGVLMGITAGARAATVAIGGLTLTLGALVVVLAAVAAAYVYLSTVETRRAEEQKKETLAAVARQESIKELVQYFKDMEYAVLNTTAAQEAYNNKKKELQKLAPELIASMGAENEKLKLQGTAIGENTEEYEKYRKKRLEVMETEIFAAKISLIWWKAMTESFKTWGQGYTSFWQRFNPLATQGLIGKAVGTAFSYFTQGQADQAKNVLDALQAEQDALMLETKNAEMAGKALVKLRDSLVTGADSVGEAFAKIRKAEGGQALIDKLNEWEKTGMKKVPFAGPDGKKMVREAAVNADDYVELMRQMQDAMAKTDAEAQKRQNSIKQAMKGIFEQAAKDTPQMVAQRQALNTLFKEAAGDQDKWNGLLAIFGGQIAKLGTSTSLAKQNFRDLAVAAKQLEDIRLEGFLKPFTDEAEKGLTAFSKTTADTVQKLADQVTEMFRDTREKNLELVRQVNDQIEASYREVYERTVVSKMAAVDQEIYHEQRRIEEIEKATEREIEARDRALQKDREVFEEKVRLAKREVEETERMLLLQFDLHAAEAKRELQLNTQLTQAQIEQRSQAIDGIRAGLKTQLDAITQARLNELALEEAIGNRRLNQQEELNAQLAAGQRAALENQREASKTIIQQIIADNQIVGQALKGIFVGLTEAAVGFFTGMLTASVSFKDRLLAIWRSIQQSLFNIFDSIAKKWIDNAVRMATAQGGFSPKSFMDSLFGKGAAQFLGSMFSKGLPGLIGAVGGTGLEAGIPIIGGTAMYGTPVSAAAAGVGGGAAAGGAAAVAPPAAGAGGITAVGVASGAGAAAAGGLVGYGVGTLMPNRATGALAGAASGAATGALMGSILPGIGNLVGAAIGGIAGFIGGIFGGGKEAREVKKARTEYLEAKGGITELKKAAEEAGVSIDKMMSTKKAKDFQAEVEKIEKALAINRFAKMEGGLDALKVKMQNLGLSFYEELGKASLSAEELAKNMELVGAKLDFVEQAGGLEELRKKAQLVGYDIQKAFDTTTIEAFNGEVAILNKQLEAQQKRIEGLNLAGQGLAQWAAGLQQGLEKGLAGLTKGKGGDNVEDLLKGFEKAKEKGYKGGIDEFAKKNADRYDLTKKQLADINKLTKDYYQNLVSVGEVSVTVFGRLIMETGSLGQAMAAVAPALDAVRTAAQKAGIPISEGLRHLLHLQQTIKDNADVVTILDGVTATVKGLAAAFGLTAADANRMGAQIKSAYDQLIARGVPANEALLLMQPSLQALYEAQKKFHLEIDPTTQALINMGKEHGLVGDQFKSVSEQMLDILKIIAQELGHEFPEAMQNATGAIGDAGDATNDLGDEAREAGRRYDEMGRKAEAAGRKAEMAAGDAAEGHSPTGIKQITVRLKEAIDYFEQLEGVASGSMSTVEGAAADAASAIGGTQTAAQQGLTAGATAAGATAAQVTKIGDAVVDTAAKAEAVKKSVGDTFADIFNRAKAGESADSILARFQGMKEKLSADKQVLAALFADIFQAAKAGESADAIMARYEDLKAKLAQDKIQLVDPAEISRGAQLFLAATGKMKDGFATIPEEAQQDLDKLMDAIKNLDFEEIGRIFGIPAEQAKKEWEDAQKVIDDWQPPDWGDIKPPDILPTPEELQDKFEKLKAAFAAMDFSEVAHMLGLPVEEVKQRWEDLKDYFADMDMTLPEIPPIDWPPPGFPTPEEAEAQMKALKDAFARVDFAEVGRLLDMPIEEVKKHWEDLKLLVETPPDFERWYATGDLETFTGAVKDNEQALHDWLEKQREINQSRDETPEKTEAVGDYKDAVGGAEESLRKWLEKFHELNQDAPEVKGHLDDAGGAVQDVTSYLDDAIQKWHEFEEAARSAGKAGEEAGTRTAEGHSPTGIKQVTVRLNEAILAFNAVETVAGGSMATVEQAATEASSAIASTTSTVQGGMTTLAATSASTISSATEAAKGGVMSLGQTATAAASQVATASDAAHGGMVRVGQAAADSASQIAASSEAASGGWVKVGQAVTTAVSQVTHTTEAVAGGMVGLGQKATDVASRITSSSEAVRGGVIMLGQAAAETAGKVTAANTTMQTGFTGVAQAATEATTKVAATGETVADNAAKAQKRLADIAAQTAGGIALATGRLLKNGLIDVSRMTEEQIDRLRRAIQSHDWATMGRLLGMSAKEVKKAWEDAQAAQEKAREEMQKRHPGMRTMAEPAKAATDAVKGATQALDQWLQKEKELNQNPQQVDERTQAVNHHTTAVKNSERTLANWLDRFHELNRDAQEVKTPLDHAGDAVRGVSSNLDTAITKWRDFKTAAMDAGRAGEEAATGVAEGHSPTGVKQITVRLREAIEWMDRFGQKSREGFSEAERNAAKGGRDERAATRRARPDAPETVVLGRESGRGAGNTYHINVDNHVSTIDNRGFQSPKVSDAMLDALIARLEARDKKARKFETSREKVMVKGRGRQ